MTVSLIVAMSKNGVIGREGGMPWHLSDDLKRFKRLTMNHSIVMGRKTYESIGRLLPGRRTIIVSRNPEYQVPGALCVYNPVAALQKTSNTDEIFIVGGGEIYRLTLPLAQRLYVTRVLADVAGDTHFPEVNWDDWRLTHSESRVADTRNDFDFTFETYERTS